MRPDVSNLIEALRACRSQAQHVLLALADYGNEKGTSIFPSMATLAAKCNMSETLVRKKVKALKKQQVIEVTQNESGGLAADGKGATCRIRIDLDTLAGMQPLKEARDAATAHRRAERRAGESARYAIKKAAAKGVTSDTLKAIAKGAASDTLTNTVNSANSVKGCLIECGKGAGSDADRVPDQTPNPLLTVTEPLDSCPKKSTNEKGTATKPETYNRASDPFHVSQ